MCEGTFNKRITQGYYTLAKFTSSDKNFCSSLDQAIGIKWENDDTEEICHIPTNVRLGYHIYADH